jgi:site-specific DNA-methyltransferase (adenine-specific)
MNVDYIECGDCLELMKDIPDNSIDMILCDLPYGTTACKWDTVIPFEPLWEQYNRIIKDNGAIVLFGSEPFSSALRVSQLDKFKYDWIWDKKTGLGFLDSKYRPLKQHEIISVFSKGGCSNGSKIQMTYNPQNLIPTTKKNRNAKSNILNSEPKQRKDLDTKFTNYPKSILTYARETGFHPTQKPVALLEYLIKTYTNEGDVVLDNCMGSGSTCVACVNTGRHYIGFEKEPIYYDIACQRLDEAESASENG